MTKHNPYNLQAVLLLGLLCSTATAVGAQDVRIEHVTVEDGLSNNLVFSVLQDRRGYVWAGTDQGLNRYDGYDIKVYRHNPGDTTSLSFDEIWALHEDPDGILWVGTTGGGLNRFDPATGIFTSYRHRQGDPNSLSHDDVRALHDGPDGTLWVGTEGGGLNRFDPATGTFTRYQHQEDDPNSLSHDRIWALQVTADGTLWVGSWGGGLNRFDPVTGTFSAYRHREDAPTSLSSDWVNALYEGPDGTLWVGTTGGGLNRLDPATGIFTSYRHRQDDPNSLNDDDIWALHEGPDGTLWISSRGLTHFDPRTETFTQYRHREGDPTSLIHDRTTSLDMGGSGTLWVGTGGGGLNRVDISRSALGQAFTTYRHREDDPTSLRNNDVKAMHAARDGTIWVGTYGGGLNRFVPSAGSGQGFTAYQPRVGDPASLSDNLIRSIYETQDGMLWVGTRTAGLNRFDRATGTFTTYRHQKDDPTSLSHDWVWALREGYDGTFWVATEAGLNRFNRATGTFTRYQNQEDNPASLSDDRTLALHAGADGLLWIGTAWGGLNRFDPQTETFTAYRHRTDDPTSLSHDEIRWIHEGRDGRLWIGAGNGLNLLQGDPVNDPASVSFIRYTDETSNLDGSAVMSILEEDTGTLWLGLYSGLLARFNPQTEQIRLFGSRHGVDVGGFDRAAARTKEGTLVFGGLKGLIHFDPAQIEDNLDPPRLYLSDLWLFNQRVEPGPNAPLKIPLSETSEVVLRHHENDIAIGFVGIHYANTAGNRYDYRLLPYDQNWRGVTAERRATYTALPPGRYHFEVKAANSDGIWTAEPVTVNVVIRPPWWRTTWAYLLYGLLVLAGVFTIDRIQRRRLIAREREKAREREREQAREIEKAYHELRETKDRLVQQEKMASLGQLTAGIAHEIKNPLNFVNNFAEVNEELADELEEAVDAGETPENLKAIIADLKQNAQVINQHGKRADGIVHAMMQHASGGTGQREAVDINQLVSEHIDLAYHGKRAQNPELQVEIERDLGEVGAIEIVPQEIGRVLLNLLGNAFDAVHEHAAGAGGDYTPTVTVSTLQIDGRIEIRVSDNGPGIPIDIKEKIFEPFFTTKPTGSGTGLGLSLSYDIVTQGHGGTLAVESEEGQGATFVVTLPSTPQP